MVDLNQTISYLEKARQSLGPERNASHDVRMHIARALHEASHVMKKESVRAAKKEGPTPWEQWRLDLEKSTLMNPREQKVAVNVIDNMIDDEKNKLAALERKITDGQNTSVDSTSVGTFFG